MTDELRNALEAIADRGTPAGASATVDRAAKTAARRHRHRHRHRIARAGVLLAAAAFLAVAGTAVYVKQRIDSIPRVDVSGSLHLGGSDVPSEPMNVLVIGSDARPGLDGERADTLVVIRVEPATRRVSMLSIPRDLWVDDAKTRINSTLADGPAALIDAVTTTLGVPVHHYVEVRFDGFRRLVDAVGGVDIPFPTRARDIVSGFHAAPGCAHLDGDMALAFVRSRHYETFAGGRWMVDPTSDFGRIARQQEFLRRLALELSDMGVNPVRLNSALDAAADNLTLDRTFSTKDLRRLAGLLKGTDPAAIQGWTVPTTNAEIGGAAVLRLEAAALPSVIDGFLGQAPTTAPALPAPGAPQAPGC